MTSTMAAPRVWKLSLAKPWRISACSSAVGGRPAAAKAAVRAVMRLASRDAMTIPQTKPTIATSAPHMKSLPEAVRIHPPSVAEACIHIRPKPARTVRPAMLAI